VATGHEPAMPGKRTKPPERHGYHHGALRQTLIDATDSLLAERGVAGFSLREVARRSGVAPSAPAHHFGDTAGLLDAVAAVAFDGLTRALEAGNARGGTDPVARLREQGVGYVAFAMRYPERFALMFRKSGDASATLQANARAAFLVLEQEVRQLYGLAGDAPLSPPQMLTLLSVWSVVHGFAHLAIAGQFDRFATQGGREQFVRSALAPMLQQLLTGLAPPFSPSVAPAKPRSRAVKQRVKARSS
jgi:AcrR family transcriptional regulator